MLSLRVCFPLFGDKKFEVEVKNSKWRPSFLSFRAIICPVEVGWVRQSSRRPFL
jgi:hypothetical protein